MNLDVDFLIDFFNKNSGDFKDELDKQDDASASSGGGGGGSWW